MGKGVTSRGAERGVALNLGSAPEAIQLFIALIALDATKDGTFARVIGWEVGAGRLGGARDLGGIERARSQGCGTLAANPFERVTARAERWGRVHSLGLPKRAGTRGSAGGEAPRRQAMGLADAYSLTPARRRGGKGCQGWEDLAEGTSGRSGLGGLGPRALCSLRAGTAFVEGTLGRGRSSRAHVCDTAPRSRNEQRFAAEGLRSGALRTR